jgi:hypothetical protein
MHSLHEIASDAGSKPYVKVTKCRPYRNGSMRAFFSVELPSGIIINELRGMASGRDGYWIAKSSQLQVLAALLPQQAPELWN